MTCFQSYACYFPHSVRRVGSRDGLVNGLLDGLVNGPLDGLVNGNDGRPLGLGRQGFFFRQSPMQKKQRNSPFLSLAFSRHSLNLLSQIFYIKEEENKRMLRQ